MSTISDYLTNLIAQRDNLAAQLAAKGEVASSAELFDTLVPKVANLQPAAYELGVGYFINSLTFSGTYANSTYFTEANCSCFRDAAGRIALVMQGGITASYENLRFTLNDSTGLGIVLDGQSVYNYTSASTGQYYVAVLTGIIAPVNISVNLSSISSTYDYVTCEINITLAS